MKSRPTLKLETTGQYLGLPMVEAHDNAEPVWSAVDRCLLQLARISGH
jgi:hypothetical protein